MYQKRGGVSKCNAEGMAPDGLEEGLFNLLLEKGWARVLENLPSLPHKEPPRKFKFYM